MKRFLFVCLFVLIKLSLSVPDIQKQENHVHKLIKGFEDSLAVSKQFFKPNHVMTKNRFLEILYSNVKQLNSMNMDLLELMADSLARNFKILDNKYLQQNTVSRRIQFNLLIKSIQEIIDLTVNSYIKLSYMDSSIKRHDYVFNEDFYFISKIINIRKGLIYSELELDMFKLILSMMFENFKDLVDIDFITFPLILENLHGIQEVLEEKVTKRKFLKYSRKSEKRIKSLLDKYS